VLSFCFADAAAESLDLFLVFLVSRCSPVLPGSISGAELRPSSTLGGRAVGFVQGPGLRLTLSNMSVTDADRGVTGSLVDD